MLTEFQSSDDLSHVAGPMLRNRFGYHRTGQLYHAVEKSTYKGQFANGLRAGPLDSTFVVFI